MKQRLNDVPGRVPEVPLHYPILFEYDKRDNIGMIRHYNGDTLCTRKGTDVVDALGARLQVVLTRRSPFSVERSPDLHTGRTIVLYAD